MKNVTSLKAVWPLLAVIAVLIIAVAAIQWSRAHPVGLFWDEASYFNEVQIDAQRLRTGHLLRLGGRIFIKNLGRPPAFRLIALPIVALLGFDPTGVRLTSIACFAMSGLFVYLAVRRFSTPTAASIAAIFFTLSPEVVSASMFFSTDAPLYLATAAMLYYVFASWTDGTERTSNWVGLGLAVGLGFLAKTSFIVIGLPVLAFWFAAHLWKPSLIPPLLSQRKAGVLAFLIAAPWWVLSGKGALEYMRYSRNYVMVTFGPPSLATWAHWANSVVQSLLGHGLSLLLGLILITSLVMIARRKKILSELELAALGACACAGLPIVLAQLSGTNHLLRHITPMVVPLAISAGILAGKSGWTRSRLALSISALLFCGQLILLLAPVVYPNTKPVYPGFVNGALPWRAMVRYEQWDWQPILDLADRCAVRSPAISHLGIGRAFSPPHLQHPWVARETATRAANLEIPVVTWLWRYEDGPFEWQKVMDRAGQTDMVITAPHLIGEDSESIDNQYNSEFAAHLSQNPKFQGPFRFNMGRFDPVEVVVFMKSNLTCRSASLQ